jgi:hypothetical protein
LDNIQVIIDEWLANYIGLVLWEAKKKLKLQVLSTKKASIKFCPWLFMTFFSTSGNKISKQKKHR